MINVVVPQDTAATTENRTDEAIHSHYGTAVMATMIQAGEEVQYKLSATSSHEKLGNLLFTKSLLTPNIDAIICSPVNFNTFYLRGLRK